jgi:NADH-quinone oxidoreductase subunit F
VAEPVQVLTQRFDVADAHTLDAYLRTGGYTALRAALEMDPGEIVQLVKDAGLRGRGGAGFPTGVKWGFVPADTGKPVYLVVNADEGEPGTFKDRELMERDPHQLLEGMVIAARALGSQRAFVFVRGEYLWPGIRLEEAIAEAYANGYLGKDVLGSGVEFHASVHYAAGAYICGEETALLEALEGRRGQPRLRPPFPAIAGLYACPTAVNNVETIMNVPHIVERGVDWYRSMGTDRSPGPKVFCVSGEVARPGNYEWPLGTTARQVLEESCGGMLPGRRLACWTPGGSSTPLLTAAHLDVGMDFESVAAAGSLLGTTAMIMLSERTCVVAAVRRWIEFYEHESCGKCTPCREGNFWASRILRRIETGHGRMSDLELIDDVCDYMFTRSFCALADGAVSPMRSSLAHFRDHYEAHISDGVCPLGATGHAGPVLVNAGHARPGDQPGGAR